MLDTDENILPCFKQYMVTGNVEQKEIHLLRDSGTSRSFLRTDLVRKEDIIKDKLVKISTPGREPFLAKLANIKFSSQELNIKKPILYEFVLLDFGLPADGIIGNDMATNIPNFEDVISSSKLIKQSNAACGSSNTTRGKDRVNKIQVSNQNIQTKIKKLSRTQRTRRRNETRSLVGEDVEIYWKEIQSKQIEKKKVL